MNYVTIAETGGLTKRFRATEMQENYSAPGYNISLDGSLDPVWGPQDTMHSLMLWVPYTVSDSNYGTVADLMTIFGRSNPGATPSTRFTYTDHFGTAHSNAFFDQPNLQITPFGWQIEGTTAYYQAQVSVRW